MATVMEIMQLSVAHEKALDTLVAHTARPGGVCRMCGVRPCPAAAAAVKIIAWCERRIIQINQEINAGIGAWLAARPQRPALPAPAPGPSAALALAPAVRAGAVPGVCAA